MIPTENFIMMALAFLTLGAILIWRHGTKCYDRGITDAILMHRNGRHDNGSKMINIEIDPLEGDE
jgi:hypothetical protein